MGGPGSGVGNKSRTGMPRPEGSGSKPEMSDPVSFTFWIERADRDSLQQLADTGGLSLAAYLRQMIADEVSNG